jgi:hypothetical protein
VSPLTPGTSTTWTVEGAAPGDSVVILRGTASANGACPPVLQGECLGLASGVQVLGTATANGAGTATLTRTVPARVPAGRDVSFQAVVRVGAQLSPVVTTTTQGSGGGASDVPTLAWHTGWGTRFEEHVHEGITTTDGGYVGVGHTHEGTNALVDMMIIKVDDQGQSVWRTIVGTSGAYDLGIAVVEVDDGFLVGGGLSASGRQQPAIVKLDLDGNVLWEQILTSPGIGAVRGIDVLPDGSFVATGYANDADPGFLFIADGGGSGFLSKLDASGQEAWRQTLPVPQGTKVRALDDGFIVASTAWTPNDRQNAALIRTDTSGQVQWTETYGGSNNVQAFDFDHDGAGGFILTGHTTGYGAANWDCIAIRVDGNGTEQWVQRFGQPRGYDAQYIHDECYGVRHLPEGGFIVAGGSGDEYGSYSSCSHPQGCSDEWKSYLVRLEDDGTIAWQATYGTPNQGNNAAEFLSLTPDGGYLLFNDTDSQGTMAPNNFGFMKLDPVP